MEYRYKISNKKETKNGTIEAESREEAAELIRKEGYFIMELAENKHEGLFNLAIGDEEKMNEFDKINLTDHLASMIGAGTPIREALEAYSEDGVKKNEILSRVVKDIERGKKLSVALLNFPKIFTPLYISLVQAGEMSGSLDETLAYLANELRREYDFKQRVKAALFYPVLVLVVSIGVIILVVTTVIPKVAEITKSMGTTMPALTRIVVGLSDFITKNWLLMVFFTIAVITGIIFFLKKESVRESIKSKLLTMPVVGPIMRKYILARLLRIIGSSIKYGVALPQALEAAKGIANNALYKEALIRINKKITKGENLSRTFSDESKLLFPGIITRSLKGAEKTGSIDSTLFRLSTQYEIEVERDLKKATELLEPIMIVILGVIVLGVAISVVAPIYQLTSDIK